MALKRTEEGKDLKETTTTVEKDSSSNGIFDTETKTETKVEVEAPKEEVKANPEMISKDVVREMMAEMQRDFKQELNLRLQEERKLFEGRKAIKEGEDYGKDLVDDYLEKPVTFFSYHSNYIYAGDIRKGKESVPPGGVLKFKNLIRSKRRNGTSTQVISISTVSVQSKELLDFMRQSPYFGIIFHETIDQALTVDALWAQKLIEANQQVQRMSDPSVIDRCAKEGIPLSTDTHLMRRQLIELVAEKAKAQYENVNNEIRNKLAKMTSPEEGDGVERNYISGKVTV